MARVIREFESRARVSESQRLIKDYLDSRFGLESKTLQFKVEKIIDLDILHYLLRDLYRTDNRIEMEKLIDVAIEKQGQMRKEI